MGMKAIRRQADELLALGFAHQQAFDQLILEHPEAKPERVAEYLGHRPSLWARERYRNMHRWLMALIVLSACLRVWHAVEGRELRLDQAASFIVLVPIATLLGGYSLYKWQGEVFRWVGWANVWTGVGFVTSLLAWVQGHGDPRRVPPAALSFGIGVLALLLWRRAFPKYEMRREIPGGPQRALFRQDDMGMITR
jgi:hypothetical protein